MQVKDRQFLRFHGFRLALVSLLFSISLGLKAQRVYNVNVYIAPFDNNWCFGDEYLLGTVAIYEVKDSTNAFGNTHNRDSNIVVIEPPGGYHFKDTDPSVTVYPDDNPNVTDTYIKNNGTDILFSFRTNKGDKQDSI